MVPRPGIVRKLIAIVTFVALPACHRTPPQADADTPPAVGVSRPVQRNVTESVDLTGRTQAPQSVEIRARVSGYLVKMPFLEGAEVKAGDLLFEIDPRPYQAQLNSAVAQVASAEAKVKLAKADNERAKDLLKQNIGAISQQDLDKYQAAYDEAVATLAVAKANVESCQLNLDFTKITSPVAGKVSRYYYTLGNLVNPDTMTLTTVVSEDPIQVYFDVDEPTMLRILRDVLASHEAPQTLIERKIPVQIGLADETGFPHRGLLDFANNAVSSTTGTITTRAVFANPAGPTGVRLLRPGMFVRVRLPLGKPHAALLVTDRALGTDQGEKYLLVVNADNVVETRRVTVGSLQEDGLRVISDGLKADDRVLISGLQIVHPRMKVQVEEVPMPVGPTGAATAKSS